MEGLGSFGAFAGWQTAALKANRKPLLWPWVESFGAFGVFAGWQTAALKANESHCCGLGPGVPVGEVALALGCLLGTVFGGLGRFGGFGRCVWRV